MTRFDASKRQRFLSLLGRGRSVTEAAASVGISTTTVAKWAARGRAPEADAESAAFTLTYDALRHGSVDGRRTDDNEPPLTSDDVLMLLERSARGGSVTAQKTLLVELRRRETAASTAQLLRDLGVKDPFDGGASERRPRRAEGRR